MEFCARRAGGNGYRTLESDVVDAGATGGSDESRFKSSPTVNRGDLFTAECGVGGEGYRYVR